MEKMFYNSQDVADILGISLGKSYGLFNTPGFPGLRVGSSYRVSVELFNEWVKQNIGSSFKVKPKKRMANNRKTKQ